MRVTIGRQPIQVRLGNSVAVTPDVAALALLSNKIDVADLASAASGKGAALVGFKQSDSGAVARTMEDKAREHVSVLDYGADPTGGIDSTAAFQAAYAANAGGSIEVPAGTYLGGAQIVKLDQTGTRWIGASKYSTIIKAKPGTTGSLCQGTGFASGTAAYCGIEKMRFDLAGEDCTAVDLSSLNNSAVRDCYFVGGMGFGSASTTNGSAIVTLAGGETTARVRVGQQVFGPHVPAGATVASVNSATQFTMSANATATDAATQVYTVAGTAIRCAAPLDRGSYTNDIHACAGLYLKRSFVAEDAANENTFTNCEAIACGIGFDVENGVDMGGILRGRAEGCDIGLRTGGRETTALSVRFENNFTADVSFAAGCERPSFLSCHTATSTTTFQNESNCTGLFSRGGSFPQRDYEPNVSNPRIQAGRTTFASAASAAGFQVNPTSALPGSLSAYSAYFYDPVFLRNAAGSIEAVNGTGDNTVLALSVDSSNRVSIPGYDRKSGTYTRLYLGEHFSINGTGLEFDGVKVMGARQTAVGDASNAAAAPTQAEFNALVAKFNLLLDKLGASGHGLTADA